MRRRSIKERAGIEANLTSLIDVTFLLIVFFVLVSRLNEMEQIEIDLPSPANAATAELKSENQVVINVLPGLEGNAAGYRVGAVDFPPNDSGLKSMTSHLAGLYRLNPALDLDVRAARQTRFDQVEPVMRAISTAAHAVPGITAAHVNLAVVREQR